MSSVDFISDLHKKTGRNYIERVLGQDKAVCAAEAKKFGGNYWDGERKYGYGGYRYDGRWESAARKMIAHYRLNPKKRVLDVGCGKGFLLFELARLITGMEVRGADISRYAVENGKEEIKSFLDVAEAQNLPYDDRSFDLVVSINTLHNLYVFDLEKALGEIERVSRGNSYIVVESYRNENEKANLLNWQLTCECFFTPDEWEWLFGKFGYSGDYSFIFFE